jgi:hypothetical protein
MSLNDPLPHRFATIAQLEVNIRSPIQMNAGFSDLSGTAEYPAGIALLARKSARINGRLATEFFNGEM